MTELKLLTDEALCRETEEYDGLGFRRYAEILGNAAIETKGPFAIGVFGEWGTGKTSLMRLIQSHLDDQEGVVTVWFNAWQYAEETQPVIPLIATILKQLEAHRGTAEKIKERMRELSNTLRSIAYGFSIGTKVKIPGFSELEASFVAKDMIDRSRELTTDPLLDRSICYDAFERLSTIKAEENPKIVVLIDDLDRCFPDSAIRLLESIKLVFPHKSFIFVIGVARKIIEGYLTHRYREKYGINDFQGHSYLDKIIQLPFHLPSHRPQMEKFRGRVINRLSGTVQPVIESIFSTVVAAANNNPRAIIRFINNILIDFAIQNSLADQKQGGETEKIPLSYFAITRCLQAEWSDIFGILMGSDSVRNDVIGWSRIGDPGAVAEKNATSEDSSTILRRLKRDKNLRELLFSTEGISWLENRDKRNATVEFLRTERAENPSSGQRAFVSVAFIFASEHANDVAQISDTLLSLGITSIKVDTSLQEIGVCT